MNSSSGSLCSLVCFAFSFLSSVSSQYLWGSFVYGKDESTTLVEGSVLDLVSLKEMKFEQFIRNNLVLAEYSHNVDQLRCQLFCDQRWLLSRFGENKAHRFIARKAEMEGSINPEFMSQIDSMIKSNGGQDNPKRIDNKTPSIRLRLISDRVDAHPRNMVMSTGEWVLLAADSDVPMEDLRIFSTHENIVSYDAAAKRFSSRENGKSEIYFIYGDRATKIDISVETNEGIRGLISEIGKDDQQKPLVLERPIIGAKIRSSVAASLSNMLNVEDSEEKSLELLKERQEKRLRFYREQKQMIDLSVTFQIVMQRSKIVPADLFPLEDIAVRINGSDAVGFTDRSGKVSFNGLPAGSRFFLNLTDEKSGRILPMVHEVQLSEWEEWQPIIIKVLPYRTYEFYSRVYGFSQDVSKGSFCGQLVTPIKEIEVDITVHYEDGPFYFGQHGPDPRAPHIGSNGRFCFFNIEGGLGELVFTRHGEMVDAQIVGFYSGRHQEVLLERNFENSISVRLSAEADAYHQLYQKSDIANSLEMVDYVQVLALGEDLELIPNEPGILDLSNEISGHMSRVYGLVQAGEFESLIFPIRIGERKERTTVALPQKGFLEDLYYELTVMGGAPGEEGFDPSLGTILAHYSGEPGSAKDIKLKLIDIFGEELENGWQFGDDSEGTTKVIFYNLIPGSYSLLAIDGRESWRDIDVTIVDYWTVAKIQLGNEVRYR